MPDYVFSASFKLPRGIGSISQMSPNIRANVLKALRDGMQLTETVAIEKYMSGPTPPVETANTSPILSTKTSRLKSSIRSWAELGGTPNVFATGYVQAGSKRDLAYARIHEYGGTINHPGAIAQKSRFMKFYWRKVSKWVYMRSTKAHTIKIPARPYIAPAINDTLPIIEQMIQAAIDRAIKES